MREYLTLRSGAGHGEADELVDLVLELLVDGLHLLHVHPQFHQLHGNECNVEVALAEGEMG